MLCTQGQRRAAGCLLILRSTCKSEFLQVEPRGLEPLASALQRRHRTLLDLSVVCKIAANKRISTLVLLLMFQQVYSGCCTVAAQSLDGHGGASVLLRGKRIPHVPGCLSFVLARLTYPTCTT